MRRYQKIGILLALAILLFPAVPRSQKAARILREK